jgi:AraC-like DNA-binding protein
MFQLNRPDFFDSEEEPIKLIRRSPQIPYPLHNHDFSELVIVLSGTGVHFTKERDYRVNAGDVFVIQGATSHGYKEIEDLCLVNLLFRMDRLPLPFMDISYIPGYQALFHLEPQYRQLHNFASSLKVKPDDFLKVSSLLDRIELEYKAHQKGYRYMAALLFMELIGFLSRCYDSSESLQNRELLRIARGLSYLEHHLAEKITLKTLKEETGMSISSLNRHFRRVTGVPPLEYHLRQRIRRGCSLLKQTDLNITEFAFRTAFDDS